jgi:dienelactone hydrolase
MRASFLVVTLLGALFAANSAHAAVKVQTVEYKQGDTTLEGWLVYDTAVRGKRPGVMVYPAFFGPSAHEKDVATRLAKMGYVAFVADIYGKGIRLDTRQAAGAESAKYMKDRPLLLARAQAAFDQLRQAPMVDTSKLAAIGYCFGGAPALDLMRSGAPLVDVVTFHGSLGAPSSGEDAKNIKTHVLVLHGAIDPIVNTQAVAGFEKEMTDDNIDWQVVLYSGVMHAFTDNTHGDDPPRSAYNASADKRSWQAMSDLFKDTL